MGLNLGANVMNIPNGIDERLFEICRSTRDGKILYVGRLERYKGVHILLEALALLRNENFELGIIGDGPYREELRRLVVQLGLSDRVTFYGVVKGELIGFYANSEIFVLPSADTYLGLGLAVLDAMAASLAVIISPLQSNTLIHGRTGVVLSEFVSSEAVAEAIRQVLHDRNFATYIGNNARDAVREYSFERVFPRFLRLYSHLRDSRLVRKK